jgi:Putative regulator of cell autolysis
VIYGRIKKVYLLLKEIKHSLTLKLFIILLVSAVLPVSVSFIFSYVNSLNALEENYISSNIKTIKQDGQNISNYFDNINNLTLGLYRDSKFYRNISFEPTDFTGTQYNEQCLEEILFSRRDITYLYYYIAKRKTLYSFSKQLYTSQEFPYYGKTSNNSESSRSYNGIFINPRQNFINYSNIGYSSAQKVIIFNRNMENISTGKSIGVFSIVLDSSVVGKYCDEISDKDELVALTNRSGQIYYSNKPYVSVQNYISKNGLRNNSSGYYIQEVVGVRNIILYCKTFNGMFLIKAIPYSILQNSVAKSLSINFYIIILTIIIVTALSVFLSIYLSVPVRKIVKSMNRLSLGNFNVQVPALSRKDEIGLLIDGFNNMAAKIDNLINSEYKMRIAKKNAQLSALQAQVNPHFIYNALQSVGTLALRKNAPEIYSMSSAIANMLRYSLQNSSEMVTIRTEIENINNYLYIQKVRFGPQLQVELMVDKDIEDFLVPKLILQPLVENSIKYGLDGYKTSEIVSVTVKKESDIVIIRVSDTGRGMNEKSIRMAKEWVHQNDDVIKSGEHLGFKNVFNRISLIYGDSVEIDIESELNVGTKITIKIPQKGCEK